MTFKTFATASLFALSAFGALAAQAASTAPLETYHYGKPLDVHKVLSITEADRDTCGVTTEQMHYLDSMGGEHRVQYLVVGSNCHDNG